MTQYPCFSALFTKKSRGKNLTSATLLLSELQAHSCLLSAPFMLSYAFITFEIILCFKLLIKIFRTQTNESFTFHQNHTKNDLPL